MTQPQHPYAEYEAKPAWSLVRDALRDLADNGDVEIRTSESHVVGYVVRHLTDSGDRDAIYRALFDALLELRTEGAEKKNPRVFHLADLFHQLPNWLRELDRGDIDAEEVARRLRERAERAGTSAWLDQHLPTPAPGRGVSARRMKA